MDALELLWQSALAPIHLMELIWPWLLGLSVYGGAMGLVMRSLALSRTTRDKVHPVMHSPVRWAFITAAGTFVMLWLLISVATGALVLAAMYRD